MMGSGVILQFCSDDINTIKTCIRKLVDNKLAATGFIHEVEYFTWLVFEKKYVAEVYTDQNLSKRALEYIEEHFPKSIKSVVEIATHDLSADLYAQIRALHD